MHNSNYVGVEGCVGRVQGVRYVHFRLVGCREWIIRLGQKFIAAIKVFEELRLTVLNCLLNIFGRAHSPGPNSIRKLGLPQLSAEVDVKVIVVRVL